MPGLVGQPKICSILNSDQLDEEEESVHGCRGLWETTLTVVSLLYVANAMVLATYFADLPHCLQSHEMGCMFLVLLLCFQ